MIMPEHIAKQYDIIVEKDRMLYAELQKEYNLRKKAELSQQIAEIRKEISRLNKEYGLI